jgi:hypothetical protein
MAETWENKIDKKNQAKRKQLEIKHIIKDMSSIFSDNPSTFTWREIGEKLYEFGWRKTLPLNGERMDWKNNPLKPGDKIITMGMVHMIDIEENGVLVEFELGTQVWLIYESLYRIDGGKHSKNAEKQNWKSLKDRYEGENKIEP